MTKSSKRYSTNSAAAANGRVNVRGKDDTCCGVFFLKYVLYIFNVIFWISGFAILAIGLWTLLDKHHYVTLLTSATYAATTYLLIATGAIIILVAFIGCCGAVRENRFCLMIYAGFLLLVFLLEAVSGVLAYMYHTSVHAELERTLNHTMLHNYHLANEKTKAIDNLQQHFECCGAGSFKDWMDSEWYKNTPDLKVPDSCCKTMSLSCAKRDHPSNIYYHGCVHKLEYYLKDHLIILGAVGLGLCCLQIFGIVFSCCLARKIKQYEDRQKQNNW